MKTQTVLILKSDGRHEVREIPAQGQEGHLKALQACVGGLIQTLPAKAFGRATCYVNEEGLLIDLPESVWPYRLKACPPFCGAQGHKEPERG